MDYIVSQIIANALLNTIVFYTKLYTLKSTLFLIFKLIFSYKNELLLLLIDKKYFQIRFYLENIYNSENKTPI